LGLGQLYVSQKRYDKAITSYQKALELKPDSAEAYAFLGEVYLLQGKANEALLMLEKAQQFDKNDPPSAAEMAKSLLEAHREGCFIQKPL
jgi:tetratricopeptide (TPR) repeat protein